MTISSRVVPVSRDDYPSLLRAVCAQGRALPRVASTLPVGVVALPEHRRAQLWVRSSTCRELLWRSQVVVIVIVIVDAGFAERFRGRDRDPASPVVVGVIGFADWVTRLRR